MILIPYTHPPKTMLPGAIYGNVSKNDYSYYDFLRENWEYPGDIFIVEHDMVVTPVQLKELGHCPEVLCSQAYQVRHPPYYWCHNQQVVPFARHARWVEPGTEFAMFSGLGCCKISKRVRIGKMPKRTKWNWLDLAVSKSLNHPWHIHWPGVTNGTLQTNQMRAKVGL